MKKTMKMHFVAVLALLILGACNTSQDVASGGFITKRKYNKGFHINLNKNYKSTKGTDLIKVEEELAMSNDIEFNQISPSSRSEVYSTKENTFEIDGVSNEEYIETAFISKEKSFVASTDNKKEVFHAFNQLSKDDKKVIKNAKHVLKNKKEFNKNAIENDLLISLLFIIFGLSFLGVWWHEGKTWTKRCTINLILWLLCGLPGFIHGLIVVLGDK
jgi:uncharacterized membrane protein YqaE (UPF0057 family)/predicted small secreted protein